MDLQQWFQNPKTTLTYEYNKSEISRDLMGTDFVQSVPPPQTLYDLAAFKTPFAVLFRKARTTLTG